MDTGNNGHTEVFRGADGKFLVARWHDVIAIFYLGQETDANMQALVAWSDVVGRAYSSGTVVALWIDSYGARNPPSAQTRALYSQYAARNHLGAQRRSYIVDCDGFAGATVRAVLTGMALATRQGVPNRVLRDPLEGIRWLWDHHADGRPGTPEQALAFFTGQLRDWHRRKR